MSTPAIYLLPFLPAPPPPHTPPLFFHLHSPTHSITLTTSQTQPRTLYLFPCSPLSSDPTPSPVPVPLIPRLVPPRFVADRGTTGQLAAVEAIDVKFNLRRDIRLPAINLREAILASEAGVGVAR